MRGIRFFGRQEHVLREAIPDIQARPHLTPGMPAAGDSPDTILAGYLWLEPEDIQACTSGSNRWLPPAVN